MVVVVAACVREVGEVIRSQPIHLSDSRGELHRIYPYKSKTSLCLTADGKWSHYAALCQVYTDSLSLYLSVCVCLSLSVRDFFTFFEPVKICFILINSLLGKFHHAEFSRQHSR